MEQGVITNERDCFSSSTRKVEDDEWFLDPKIREDAARRRSWNWISLGRPLPATPTKRRSFSRISNINGLAMPSFSDDQKSPSIKDDLMTPTWMPNPGGGMKQHILSSPDECNVSRTPNNPFGQDEFNVRNPFEPPGKTPSCVSVMNSNSPAPGSLKDETLNFKPQSQSPTIEATPENFRRPMLPLSAVRLGSPSPSLPPLGTPLSKSSMRSIIKPLTFDPFLSYMQVEKLQRKDTKIPFFSPISKSSPLSTVENENILQSFGKPPRQKVQLDFNTPCRSSLPTMHLDFNTPLRPSFTLSVHKRLSPTVDRKSTTETRLTSIPSPKDTIGQELSIGRLVGSGDFGDVYRVRKKSNGKEYALKILKRCHQQNGETVLTEADALERVNRGGPHRHILNFEQAWTFQGKIHILTELCVHGNLDQVISNNSEFPEEDIWRAVVQISLGLACIHKSGLLHMDIKSANIFVEVGGVLKIGDFGTCREIGKIPAYNEFSAIGTASHLAPEQFNEDLGAVTEKADIFSMGIVAFELATSVIAPANGPKWQHLRSGKKLPLTQSNSLRDLVHALLKRSPEKRISLDSVLEIAKAQGIADTNTNLKLVKLPPPVRRSLSSGSPLPQFS